MSEYEQSCLKSHKFENDQFAEQCFHAGCDYKEFRGFAEQDGEVDVRIIGHIGHCACHAGTAS